MEFGIGSQVSEKFSFQTFLRKIKYFGVLLAQIQAKMKFLQVIDCHFSGAKIMYFTSLKIRRKLINYSSEKCWTNQLFMGVQYTKLTWRHMSFE